MNHSERPFGGPNTFCFPVAGNSMYNPGGDKSYQPGEFVTVDPDRKAVDGSMVVVRFGDTHILRQLMIEPNGEMTLHAINPGWPDTVIRLDESVTICGVVTGKWTEEV